MVEIKIRDEFLFRIEYFGGILISKKDFKRKELNFEESLFLFAYNYVDLLSAKNIVMKVLNIDSIDIDHMVSLDIYSCFDDEEKYEEDEIHRMTYNIYMKAKNERMMSFPLEVVIYPSMRCSLSCDFCFVNEKEDTEIHSAYEWEAIINQSKQYGALSISILGGEPTLYYDIDNLLLACENAKINTVITTNALRIKESTKEILVNSQYIIPAVSIQSFDDLNYKLMGCSHEKQISLVEFMRNRGKDIRINSVYTFQTIEQIQSIYDYCVSRGIRRYSVSAYSNIKSNNHMSNAHDLAKLFDLDNDMEKYITDKYADSDNLTTFSAEGCLLYSCYATEVEEKIDFTEFEKQYFGCRGKFTKIEICSDGSVFPCFNFESITQSKSNVFQDDLINIWKNDLNYQAIREQQTSNTSCIECGFYTICQGGCYVSMLKENGNLCNTNKDINCMAKWSDEI